VAVQVRRIEKETIMKNRSGSSSQDVIGFLKSQHEQIKGLFEEVLAAKGAARKRSFTTLKALMAAHEAAEEKTVHPVAKRAIDMGTAEVADRLEEENEAKTAISELGKLDVDSKEFESKFLTLQKAVLAHAQSEETKEFDKLAEKLGPKELQAMRGEAVEVEGKWANETAR
jgi:hemerythrin superfamily protein